MNPMVPGLTGDKMSASVEDSKIDLLDTKDQIKKKLKKAFCEPGNIENNGVLAFCKSVIFPLIEIKKQNGLIIPRSAQYGGPVSFSNYTQLEEGFVKQDVHPGDLKNGVAEYLNELLEPIREDFKSEEMQKLILDAYPPPVPIQQKKKKVIRTKRATTTTTTNDNCI